MVTSFILCFVACLIFRAGAGAADRWRAAVLVLLLLASKAFMDWSTSGLENPLSAVWAVCFVVSLRYVSGNVRVVVRRLLLIASLAYVTRQDTVLLYLPACAWYVWTRRRVIRIADLIIGALPAVFWTTFALCYCGFPFPHTPYAKALVGGIPFDSRVGQGMANIQIAVLWDPITPVMLLVFMYVAIRSRSDQWLALAWGVLAYLAYVVLVASSSSTMALRFFSVPVVVAVAVAASEFDPSEGLVSAILVLFFIAVPPLSPMRTLGCRWAAT